MTQNLYAIDGNVILIDGKLMQEPPPPALNFRLLVPSNNVYIAGLLLNETDDIIWRRNIDGVESHLKRPTASFFDRATTYTLTMKDADAWAKITLLFVSEAGIILNIDSIDFSIMTGLEQVYFGGNPNDTSHITGSLSTFDLSTCLNLDRFTLYNTDIAGNIQDLKLTNNTNLTAIIIGSNPLVVGDIAQWDLTSCIALINFSVNSNLNGNLDGFDMTNKPNLTNFLITSPNLTGDLGGFDMTGMPALDYFSVAYNPNLGGDITNWDLTQNVNLRLLYFYASEVGGDITQIDFSQNVLLEKLQSSVNVTGDVANFDFSNNINLQYLSFSSNNLFGNIEDLNLTNNVNLIGVWLDRNYNLAGDIAQVNITNNVVLTNFSCSYTDVSGNINEFDVTNNLTLVNFIFNNTNVTGDISQVDWSNNSNLAYIYLHLTNINGDLTNLDTTNNILLKRLLVSNTNVTGDIANMSLGHLDALQGLAINSTNITGDVTQLDLSGCDALASLEANRLAITGDISTWTLLENSATFQLLDLRYCTNISYSSSDGVLARHNMPTNAVLYFDYCDFSASEVDNILVDLVATNRDGYGVFMTGANSAPTATGDAAIVTLTTEPLSWIVGTNN